MKLVFWLEEYSAQMMLEGMIPNLFVDKKQDPNLILEYHTFQGKSDLKKKIKQKISGYYDNNMKVAHVVLIDQDANDCSKEKQFLFLLLTDLRDKNILVRIACSELETFYLADLQAVSDALKMPKLNKLKEKKRYHDPDNNCKNKPSDQLIKITEGNYQKVAGSRAIGKMLDITNTRSNSFHQLVVGIRKLLILVGIDSSLLR